MADYFYKDCSLGDRIQVISCLAEAVKELGDNPEKYRTEEEINNEEAFYFRKVESKYGKFMDEYSETGAECSFVGEATRTV